ncbi:hypothetical protein BKA57DRAFT_442859 [Linnemannia elongata]|nr:hypothetical protein BKA57DRAFT_442859 [Linnemannia elongata]
MATEKDGMNKGIDNDKSKSMESKISDAMALSPQDQGFKLTKPPLQVPEDISRMILSPQVIECKLICSSDNGDVATISGSCGTGINKVCQEFKGIEKDSEKNLQRFPPPLTAVGLKPSSSPLVKNGNEED